MLIKMQKSQLNLIYAQTVRIFALMNVSSHYWSSFHANDCVFSRDEQQKVYIVKYFYHEPVAWGIGRPPPVYLTLNKLSYLFF